MFLITKKFLDLASATHSYKFKTFLLMRSKNFVSSFLLIVSGLLFIRGKPTSKLNTMPNTQHQRL